MKILIVKFGAMGDVVRTSYFAGALKRKYGNILNLTWITSSIAVPLLESNPYIDNLTTNFDCLKNDYFDLVFSLDDEIQIVDEVSKLNYSKVVGAIIEGEKLTYTEDSSEWFNMGLLSKLGKNRADELKKHNVYGHREIFKRIFQVDEVYPEFFLNADGKLASFPHDSGDLVGINPYAGGRWPSKEIRDSELYKFICMISMGHVFPRPVTIVLFGAGPDRLRNDLLVSKLYADSINQNIIVANTDDSVMTLAGYISKLKILITSDSLAMHLAIAQKVTTLAFFSPTSASEIDSFGVCRKLISTTDDYCSYAKDCDNSSITALRLIDELAKIYAS